MRAIDAIPEHPRDDDWSMGLDVIPEDLRNAIVSRHRASFPSGGDPAYAWKLVEQAAQRHGVDVRLLSEAAIRGFLGPCSAIHFARDWFRDRATKENET